MKNPDDASVWLQRAESNFERAKGGRTSKKIFYEDLCFDCQQAVEKSLKAILIFHRIDYPKTHDISHLLRLLAKKDILIPKIILKTETLSYYAVVTRYLGNENPMTYSNYTAALKLTSKAIEWAKSIIENKSGKLF